MPLLALNISLPSMQTMTKEDEVGMGGGDWIENLFDNEILRSESTQDKAGSLPPASWDLLAIFLKS